MAKLDEVDWTVIPAPEDDGACEHLPGSELPDVALTATDGSTVNLKTLKGTTVAYVYPMTGRPDRDLPDGWDLLPGARGCTPQSCAFRDHFAELRAAGANAVFGISTQDTAYQSEAAERLHLPFALLSDTGYAFSHALQLPTFEADGQTLIKRLTLIIRDCRIEHVFYPVFPPDRNAEDVLSWLKEHG